MSVPFIFVLALVFVFFWAVLSFVFMRMSRKNKALSAVREVQPAIKLAEQWIADSQSKIERLVESAEQPLSAAQNELLELRLEAGRLPQGIKNLKLVREALNDPFEPLFKGKSLADIVRFYLGEEHHRVEEKDLVFLGTSLGEMACLEVDAAEGASLDNALRSALFRISRVGSQNPSTGGFLYFNNANHYREVLQNPQWMEGLKTQRLMAIDPRGLAAILLSLRLSRDAEKVVQVFQGGVDATRALVGQSDKMGEALSQLSADSLKLRTLTDGSGHGF